MTNNPPKTFAERRKEIGLTQEELAKAFGVSLTTIRRIEQGKDAPKPLYRLAMDGLSARNKQIGG